MSEPAVRSTRRRIRQPADRLVTRVVGVGLKYLALVLGRLELTGLQRATNLALHRLVLSYLHRHHGELIESYRSRPVPPTRGRGMRIAWVAWWQGEEAAPELVKLCLASLRRNLGDIELRVVTAANFEQYAEISPSLMSRLQRGQISLTQFSDALRFNLVRRHGGIWIDATIITPQPVATELFDRPFYSRRTHPSPDLTFVSRDRWTGFLIGGSPDNAVFAFVNDLIEEYWAHNRAPVNYFLVDYALALAYEEDIGGFHDDVDALEVNNPDLYSLVDRLTSPFDPGVYAQVTPPASPTWFYKLNWRLPVADAIDGQMTLYGHLRRTLAPKERR